MRVMFEKQKIRPQTVTALTTTHRTTCRRTSITTVCPRTTSTACRTQPRTTSAPTRQFAHCATARGATSTSMSRTSCPTSSSTSATTAAAARATTLRQTQRLPQRRSQTLAVSRRRLRRTLAEPRHRLWRLLHRRHRSISRARRHNQPPKTTRSATARALQATRALESQQTAPSPRTPTPSHALHPLPLHRPRHPRVIERAKSRKNRVMSLLIQPAANQPLIAVSWLRIELIHRLAI